MSHHQLWTEETTKTGYDQCPLAKRDFGCSRGNLKSENLGCSACSGVSSFTLFPVARLHRSSSGVIPFNRSGAHSGGTSGSLSLLLRLIAISCFLANRVLWEMGESQLCEQIEVGAVDLLETLLGEKVPFCKSLFLLELARLPTLTGVGNVAHDASGDGAGDLCPRRTSTKAAASVAEECDSDRHRCCLSESSLHVVGRSVLGSIS